MSDGSDRRVSRRQLLGWTATGVVGVTGAAVLAACGDTTPVAPTANATAVSGAPAPGGTTAPGGATAVSTAVAAAAKPKSGAPVEIRWQFRGDDVAIKGGQAAVDKLFTPNNPNIKLMIEPAPDNGTQRDEQLIAAMVSGTAPDVFESWTDNITQFADKGQVTSVEPLVKRDLKDDDVKDFYEWQWRDFVLPSGIRFGLPKYVNVMTVWCNKDLFAKAGVPLPTSDWSDKEYADTAKKLAKVTGNPTDVYGLRVPMWSWDRFWYHVEMYGGHVVNPMDTTECLLGSPEALDALEWARALEWDTKAMAQPLSLGQITDSSTPQFAAQKYAMNEEGFYPVSTNTTINKAFKWQYVEVPKGPKMRKVLGTTDGYAMWGKGKQQDASWEILKFLSGKDYQEAQVGWSGLLPVRTSVLAKWKDIVIQKYPDLADVNIDTGPNAVKAGYPGNRVLFKKDAAARQIIQPALEKIFASGNTPVTYFKDIADQVTKDQRKN